MKTIILSRKLLRVLLFTLIGLFLAASSTLLYHNIGSGDPPVMSRNEKPKIIERGPQVNKVALMVNVDWGQEHIPKLLEALAKHNAKATFFISGRFADKNPEEVKKIYAAGNEVANHGYSHPHPTQISDEQNREEIRKTHQALEKVTGKGPRWFAPPYGEYDDRLLNVAKAEGYETVYWTVDSVDWRNPTPEAWLSRVQKGMVPGALVLMHPTPSTVQALPALLKYCDEKGWKPVTMTELMTLP
ncbi:polysaccharide deacetylase family protein [Heliobacterium chlorum]|uniref:Polysaccharide deacetylase family protein n=1 Tax=Heliobacterium chlorum TaxID=2698 RepID=A0ABR7T5H2_HELCL|nr:polysaccharide deacetylase family protein [Heliobacterium chlorum]MBC9786032.1 polysaccharide deacetylase family protein [Heliobacterium chlorum]